MKNAEVWVHGTKAGVLREIAKGHEYQFTYAPGYDGPPVSLTMPVAEGNFKFDCFPAFFDGLLPEGGQLQALLRRGKLDSNDLFAQLIAVGADLVGAVSVIKMESTPSSMEAR